MINITKDEQTKKQLEVIDIKLESYFSHQRDIEEDIKKLIEERKAILKQFYKKCIEISQEVANNSK